MREIVHLQAGQCGNQIGAKVSQDSNRNPPESSSRLPFVGGFKSFSIRFSIVFMFSREFTLRNQPCISIH